jgi:ElaB/YqjD/DUF883 family membrane-anchored ribosome-binding protein
VLHTRVPAVLEEELKKLATNLRVPVSNVVRTILQDAVETLDAVQERAGDELRSVADRLQARRGRARAERTEEVVEAAPPAPLAGIIGYQPLLLAREEHCTLCGSAIAAGTNAYLGVREAPGPRALLDQACLPFSAAKTAPAEEGEDGWEPKS